ncbi:response regulator transcription factor [Fodinicola feengrottensis]|uniref:Response regulator transcription factor n=1 Tax=Fodinicola feengrottensis TaxID=435914 RepID=A0ABN2J836_9ACTN
MIRILLAEDTAILRDTLAAVLNLQDDMEVTAEVATGDRIVTAARQYKPDVALLDIDLPGVDGLTAAAVLHDQLPECRVLILTALAVPANLRIALEAHVAGFLAKDTPAAELIHAIRIVAADGRVIDPALALATLQARPSPLTDRETDVLRLHSEGLDPREIASQLYLSYGTVRNYLASASDKLGARNRIHAIKIATENQWL